MEILVNAKINGQRVPVEVSASEILYVANLIDNVLREQTKNIVVFAADSYNWINGQTRPSIGIRMAEKIDGSEKMAVVGDVFYLIAGTLRRIDNDAEIVRIQDLMKIGYTNAYLELRGQAAIGGCLSCPELGKRKIVSMNIASDRAYLTLAPMT